MKMNGKRFAFMLLLLALCAQSRPTGKTSIAIYLIKAAGI